jgi:hypothetical protein
MTSRCAAGRSTRRSWVDAGTGRAIDVLPGRDAGPLADWLKAHPGVRVICRDRAGAYAEGARDGAPAAVQVADRWHLWHNLAEHTAKAVARHRACLQQIAAAGIPAQPPPGPADSAEPVPTAESRLAARMRDQHAAVQALLARGMGVRAVARELNVDRKTARRFARAATSDDVVARAVSRPVILDRYQPHLNRRSRLRKNNGRWAITP